MKTITITVYKFNELSEEAQRKALEKLSDINLTNNWHEEIYNNAEKIGVFISDFDLSKYQCNASLEDDVNVICDKILFIHNHQPDELKLVAERFLKQHNELIETHYRPTTVEGATEIDFAKYDAAADQLETDFVREIERHFLQRLEKEYKRRTSIHAVIDTIYANSYYFTEDGNLYSTL